MREPHRLPQRPGRYPWRVTCRNLEYTGEVVVADAWRPEYGQPISSPDSHFRIVFFRHPVTVPVETVKEPRTAYILPQPTTWASPLRQAQDTPALREPGPSYQVPAGGGLAWDQVLTTGPHVDAASLLPLPGPEARVEAVARQLLETAYPCVMDTGSFPGPFTEEVARLVFQGLLGRASPPALQTAAAFAPGLGLARPAQPEHFEPTDCPLFPTLREELERHHGHWEAPYRELAQRYGLPGPLASLCLLAFVAWGQPPTELRLAQGTAIPLATGGSLHSVITAPLISCLPWVREMARSVSSLDYSSHIGWNSALPYARQVVAGLEAALRLEEVSTQETALLSALAGLAPEIAPARSAVETLVASLGSPPASARQALARLEEVARCRDYRGFWEVATRGRAAPEHLGRDLALLRRLVGLAQVANEVIAARRYLQGAEVDEAHPELALDRLSLLEQLSLANLLAQDGVWLALESLTRWFQGRYRPLYEAHHRRYHQRMAELRHRLEAAQRQAEALARLNSMVELGPAVDPTLPTEHSRLLEQVRPCPLLQAQGLEQEPRCPACGLSLAQEPPELGVAALLRRLECALGQQQRRLSSQAVQHILSRPGVAPVDRFLQVVQASDLSSLVEVIDDEVVAFLRQLLAGQEPGEAHELV